jgi:hypothetical protein
MFGIPDTRDLLISGVVLASIFGGVQTWRLHSAQTELAIERADRARERLVAEETARKAEARIASKERDHAIAQQQLVQDQQAEKDRLAADLAAARSDGDSLRADIDRYAAGALRANADAAAYKRLADRARTLGNLFKQADSLAEELARDAEQRNGEVRTLKRQLQADRSACSPP